MLLRRSRRFRHRLPIFFIHPFDLPEAFDILVRIVELADDDHFFKRDDKYGPN